jgi:hypothetical protein
MGALIKTALVADDFTRIEGGAAPRRGLCRVAVEAAAAKILGLLGGSVVGVLHWEASVRRKVGRHVHGVGVEASLRGDERRRRIFKFYSGVIVEFLVGLMGRRGERILRGLGINVFRRRWV